MYRIPARSAVFFVGYIRCLAVLALVLSPGALPATAELGGSVDTIQVDQQRMKGSLHVTAGSGYTLHEIRAENGTTVRQFVSPAGTVFGVAWQGPFTPDLQRLLGAYYERYSQAVQARRARRAPIVIHESDLVIEVTGHMRSFNGRAYVPRLSPAGVNPAFIK